MIYGSLKAIPAWHNGWTVASYLVLSLMTGALLALLLGALFGNSALVTQMINPVLLLIVTGLVIKLLYCGKLAIAHL